MTTHGETSYYISLSTGIAGTYPTTYPTGDIVYLYAVEWENTRENRDKQKEMGNNGSYNNRMGKMGREESLRRCVIVDEDGTPVQTTTLYNNIITMLDSWCGFQGAAVYMIICPIVANTTLVQPNTNRTVNLALSRSGTATPVDYMKGVPRRINTKPDGGVYMVDLMFKETTLY